MTTQSTAQSSALADLMYHRWSCRGFLADDVPRAVIEQIVDIARRTPSWCNTQPWHLHITSGPATDTFRTSLVQSWAADPQLHTDFEFPATYEGEYLERRRASGWQLYEALGVEKGDRAASAREMLRNFEFFGAPHVAIVTAPASLGVYGAVDCGLFVQSFLLAAQSYGVAAVPQAALASHSHFIRAHFDLPADRRVLLGISFGYPDPDHPANSYRTPRRAVEDVVTWAEA
ncbi:nitroreductase [Mycolicibacterium bacteremicum]|uniref:Nitroreductase n=1 Tax=Mycolicibacterium bacteremicum TaxID=564198 RepID=A0A1W9YWR7_MYCBA|nr:nitroreductase [Mycolicibacterium bacteremicum]MCV7431604.1 nitroreductase [Mycolicibacterium bacteremicum]ORA04427.1 nitroreductase [Mycolicibacterium bacteremicum]